MRVRIQMGRARPVRKGQPKNQRLAAAAGVLLAPFTLLAAVFAIWRIAADLNLASSFLFADGALSHWALWATLAVVLGWVKYRLNRHGGAGPEAVAAPPEPAVEGAMPDRADLLSRGRSR